MFIVLSCICLFSFLSNFSLASGGLSVSSCGTVAEVFAKRVGTADNLPVSPVPDATLSICSLTLKHTGGASCCDADMEKKFLVASQDYLHEHIQMSNNKLKTRIMQILKLYQDHLRQSMHEAQNKTSDTLASLYKIPKEVHKKALDGFFDHLNRFLLGSDDVRLSDIINDFFTKLFPAVFEYVLSDPSRPHQTGEYFHHCLMEYHDEIAPFGNVPTYLGRKLKYAFQRARTFTESLEVFISAIDSTDKVAVDHDCKKALSRLQFCSMCSGEVEARPCRGFCLNVMRGCLSKISEISSSWDDLVVTFEILQRSMASHNNAQELLSYLNGNITDALLQAMDDGPRIYDQVMSLCRETSQSRADTDLMNKRYSAAEDVQPSHPGSRIHAIRKDIKALMVELEDSKGFFQRIADGLCRVPEIYDQEMQSANCWNGSAVGRYMRQVPEANIISQVQHNAEVKVTLIPDITLIQVKDTLAHMRRNLSVLINEELMLSDQSYRTVVGSGGGYSTNSRDVIIDDEDFADGLSGSGSGDGMHDNEGDKNLGERPSATTSTNTGRGTTQRKDGDSKTSRPSDRGPKDSAGLATVSLSLLLVCSLLARLGLFVL